VQRWEEVTTTFIDIPVDEVKKFEDNLILK
jgi:hypothetical protein